jgi:hypothetical protein
MRHADLPDMRGTRSLLWLLAALPACADDNEPAAARAVFDSFQDALHRRDAEACRGLLTSESAAAIAEMPWDRITKQQRLQVHGSRREGRAFRVEVVDPNQHGSSGEFVVVREYGKLVVDLVASAGLTARFVEATGTKDEVEPRELTPADFDRIRLHELAQPPR